MRYGVLSDIHGNHAALCAAIDHLRVRGVDAWLCLGDIIGYGPQPNECVEAIAELGGITIAGNHEQLALHELDGDRTGWLCRSTTAWTRSRLRSDVRSYLRSLPGLMDLGRVVLAHGSLSDTEQYVRSAAHGAEQLDLLRSAHPHAGILLLGHTHRQMAFGYHTGLHPVDRPFILGADGELSLVNPGAVGQSRESEKDPLVRCAILDLDADETQFYAIPYDVSATRDELRRAGLPRECLHVHPGFGPTIIRRSRRALRVGRAVRSRNRVEG